MSVATRRALESKITRAQEAVQQVHDAQEALDNRVVSLEKDADESRSALGGLTREVGRLQDIAGEEAEQTYFLLSRQLEELKSCLEEQRRESQAMKADMVQDSMRVADLSGSVMVLQEQLQDARDATARLEMRLMVMLDHFERDD